MSVNLIELIIARKNYPVEQKKNIERIYISDMLSNNVARCFLVLPVTFLFSQRDKQTREELLSKWNVAGIYDLGNIWQPYASIRFNLLHITKDSPKKVKFAIYKKDETYMARGSDNRNGVVGEQKIIDTYSKYIKALEKYVNENKIPKGSDIAKVWSIQANKFEKKRLSINYYDPDNTEALEKLSQEKTQLLKDVVEILRPRKLQSNKNKGLILKTRDFSYPLDYNGLRTDAITSVKLRKGDILFSESFSGSQKVFLVDAEPTEPIFASSFLSVIRPISKLVNSEYLFLYLQSETAKKYFNLYQQGAFFKRIARKDLLDLPVIIPDKLTLKRSYEIFKTLFLQEEKDIIETINEQLFDQDIPTKPVQREFLLEELEELTKLKRQVLQKLINSDLSELRVCLDQKLYKSFLILSGSILEAFLLDWISEIEHKNYFSPDAKNYTLGKLVHEKLKKIHKNLFTEDVIVRIDRVRKKRNYVHPKEYFGLGSRITNDMCAEVVDDLKEIFKHRYGD